MNERRRRSGMTKRIESQDTSDNRWFVVLSLFDVLHKIINRYL